MDPAFLIKTPISSLKDPKVLSTFLTTTVNMASSGLPEIHRFITDHNDDGKAVFSKAVPEEAQWKQVGDKANFFLGYTTHGFPIPLNSADADKSPDITNYKSDLQSFSSLTNGNGTFSLLASRIYSTSDMTL
jgi:hypothetical protein